MKFLKGLSSVLFVCFGTGLASDCFASEFEENVDLYNMAAICMELSEMAGNDARVAGTMGINVPDAEVRKTYFGIVVLGLGLKIQPIVGEAWASMSTDLHAEITKNLRVLRDSDINQFTKMSLHCENWYRTSLAN